MTPMAAQLFRRCDEPLKSALAASQFFEVSALSKMAAEMVDADISAGCNEFSDFARLPAPVTTIECFFTSYRVMLLCDERGDEIRYIAFFNKNGRPEPQLTGGFRRGSSDHLPGEWLESPDNVGPNDSLMMSDDDPRMQVMTSINSVLEKYLCIINQPGLVEPRERSTDKRVLKEARRIGKSAPSVWHEYRVRIGQHCASKGDGGAETPVMPLHYVRKYFKPSVGKWVDGYWRGDIALGLHLKWYSPRLPQPQRESEAA